MLQTDITNKQTNHLDMIAPIDLTIDFGLTSDSVVPGSVIIVLHIQHLLLSKLNFDGAGVTIDVGSMKIGPRTVHIYRC